MKQWTTILLILLVLRSPAQVHCFAEIALDRSSVYVQQPFKVTITVLTATWYTQPLEFDNIQIPNAFTLPFNQTAPGMYDVKGKQYAGLQFYFIVFPYQAGNYTLPPIHIAATTPPEGSSTAVKVNISTPPRQFAVKPVPGQLSNGNWLVAKNVFISERWNRSLQHLKVGDVIERTVTISARGTLPQFIPTLTAENLSFASTYPQDAELDDERDGYDANGRLSQTMTYLLEKEGDFEIPPVVINWWNPLNNRLYKKAAAPVKLHIAANPHLGMMTTLKDSLAATQSQATAKPGKKGPYTIAGIPWYWFTLYALGTGVAVYVLTIAILRLIQWVKTSRKAYVQSEPFFFRRVRYLSGTPLLLVQHLYPWWDRLPPAKGPAAIAPAWQQQQQDDLLQTWTAINASVFAPAAVQQAPLGPTILKTFRTQLTRYRKYIRQKKGTHPQQLINGYQLPWPPDQPSR